LGMMFWRCSMNHLSAGEFLEGQQLSTSTRLASKR
jgi:hypothetical protein